jgi:NADH-quinone oxidoreductase subunit J
MAISPFLQIVLFALFAGISVLGALGMATTMSMFRSGVFLMASFLGVAALFLLLLADLLSLLQVMMYLGGMLVMILFMVLFSADPGGAMMAGMKMTRVEKTFSSGLAHSSPMASSGDTGGGHGGGHDMSMTTPARPWARVLAWAVGIVLVGALLVQPVTTAVTHAMPDPRSPERIGDLLMGKYMMAFEGAGLLILLGIYGAVLLARPSTHPDAEDRDHLRAAVDAPPADPEER